MDVRVFFGSISKTNKTYVDDHVIAEAPAGLKQHWSREKSLEKMNS